VEPPFEPPLSPLSGTAVLREPAILGRLRAITWIVTIAAVLAVFVAPHPLRGVTVIRIFAGGFEHGAWFAPLAFGFTIGAAILGFAVAFLAGGRPLARPIVLEATDDSTPNDLSDQIEARARLKGFAVEHKGQGRSILCRSMDPARSDDPTRLAQRIQVEIEPAVIGSRVRVRHEMVKSSRFNLDTGEEVVIRRFLAYLVTGEELGPLPVLPAQAWMCFWWLVLATVATTEGASLGLEEGFVATIGSTIALIGAPFSLIAVVMSRLASVRAPSFVLCPVLLAASHVVQPFLSP
jgi:hypothetical protein